jgi:hypothetical protein
MPSNYLREPAYLEPRIQRLALQRALHSEGYRRLQPPYEGRGPSGCPSSQFYLPSRSELPDLVALILLLSRRLLRQRLFTMEMELRNPLRRPP